MTHEDQTQHENKQPRHTQELLQIGAYLIAVTYAALNRSVGDWVEYPSQLAAIFAIAMYTFFFNHWMTNGRPKFGVKIILLFAVYIPLAAILSGILFYALGVTIKDAYLWLEASAPLKVFSPVLIGGVALGIGYLLFVFRARAPFVYGMTEVCIGVVVAILRIPDWSAAPTNWDSEIFIAMLSAGVYLVVRGFDNMNRGLKPESYDAVLAELKERQSKIVARLQERCEAEK